MSTLIDICEGIKTTLVAEIPDFEAESMGIPVGAQVFRDWDPIPWTAEDGLMVDRRTVYVIPLGRDFLERASRATDRNAYPVGLWIVDKYPGDWNTPGLADAKKKFVDDAVGWVDELFGIVADNDYEPTAGAFLVEGDVTEICRRDMLRAHGVFVSEIVLSFAIHETN